MTTLFLSHPDCLEHDTGPGHPERADRLRAIEEILADTPFDKLERREAPIGDLSAIEAVHPRAHIEALHAKRPEEGLVWIDPDTLMSPQSWSAALHAVGAGIYAVDEVMAGRAQNAFCAMRPPGHHAEAARAMGFCFFNNIAIAAHHARRAHDAERVAVVDFDVHHGNGTQAIFWSDKDFFYGSTHQMPLFPGTGSLSETGVGNNIFNAPLREGDGGTQFREAYETRILEPLTNFSPDLLLISAGFDAHKRDPLAGLQLVEADFYWATGRLADISDRQADGRMISMLEGGYDLDGLAKSVAAHLSILLDAGC